MNLTEYFVFLSLILCCLIQISEFKSQNSQDVIRQLATALEIIPPSKKKETPSETDYNLFQPIMANVWAT